MPHSSTSFDLKHHTNIQARTMVSCTGFCTKAQAEKLPLRGGGGGGGVGLSISSLDGQQTEHFERQWTRPPPPPPVGRLIQPTRKFTKHKTHKVCLVSFGSNRVTTQELTFILRLCSRFPRAERRFWPVFFSTCKKRE